MSETLFLAPPELELNEHFLSSEDGDRYFTRLRSTIAWRQDSMQVRGRSIDLPRLTAWYGDPGTTYAYSGIENVPLPWTRELREIKTRIEALASIEFNSVLLNLYRTGKDSMGWHSDDERELSSTIASLSLGAPRTFQLRRKAPPGEIVTMRLTSGSLLMMFGETQRRWQHRVPKEQAYGERINLTFRQVRLKAAR